MAESKRLTNIDEDADLPEHPAVDVGIYVAQSVRPCGIVEDGGSLRQNHPTAVRQLLKLDAGMVPKPVVHPEINAVTYIYK